MSEDARGGVRSGSDFFEVGTADAAGVNPEQQFAHADLWNGDSFEANVIDATIDCGQHCGWKCLGWIIERELSGNGHRSASH
jgi:hypothetical protein